MQICLFEVVNDVVVPNESTHVIPWLKKVREEYPKDYLKVYAYLFYMTCWDGRNIYINKPIEEREETIVQQLEIKFSLDTPTINYALDRCRELYETPTVKSFAAAKRMVDKVSEYLNTATPTDGKFSNIPDIDKFMNKLPDYLETYEKIGEKLRKEQSKVYGGKKLAYDQKPQQR